MLCIKDFEEYALKHLNRSARDYYKSGANHEESLRGNCKAFSKLKIIPRFLQRDVSVRQLSTTLLGNRVNFPVGVSPTAMQKMAHPDGEMATARACQEAGIIMILSTIATSSIEEVAEAAPKCTKWFQLYIYKDRKITLDLVKRAEKAGFKALVLTVDTPFFGHRYADSRNKFHLPPHLRMANFSKGKEESDSIKSSPDKSVSGLNEYASSLFDPSLTWNDVDWLKSITTLPLIVKGILSKEDALEALDHGAKAVLVSNHGARQLDCVPATIEVLPEIIEAVGSKCEVYLDGGVRTGTDILKALAIGAKAVFVGRPILWGLAYDGETGVRKVIDILKSELDMAMALSGCNRLDNLKPTLLKRSDRILSKL